MTDDTLYIIYKYICTITGLIYIGQTSRTLKKRAGHNGKNYKECTYFWAAIQKYGWQNFQAEIIGYAISELEANYLEQYFITEFDSTNPAKGYNLVSGDGFNRKHSESTKQKMSQSHKGEKNSMYNKHHTDETKALISETAKGRPNPMTGRHHTDESKTLISETAKGRPSPMTGKHHSDEAKQAISNGHKGKKRKPFSDTHRANLSRSKLGNTNGFAKGNIPWSKGKHSSNKGKSTKNNGKAWKVINGKRVWLDTK